ncbi:MAG: mechanosensitive ion channel protein MscS [Massilia sp.]|nr:mechanosensitive ion channel protein MscS [Massilia sp.]
MNLQNLLAPFAGIDAGNWLIALVVAAVSFAAIHGAVMLFRRHLCKLSTDGRADRPAAELLKATLARTSNIAVIVTSLLIGLTVLDLAPPWDERLRHLWFIALGAQLALYLDRAVTVGARRYFHHASGDPEAPSSVAHTLLVWAVKTGLWVMFGLAMLSNLGINVSTFIASLGIGGIAVALAAQNILGDLFASLSIAVDKPFEVGDAISVGEFSGKVEHVGLKTTRIRADSGEQIVMGNAELLKNTVRNFKRMSTRRVQFSLMADPATPPALARKLPDVLRKIVERQGEVRFDRAHLKKVTQESLEFELVFYVLDAGYGKFMDAQQAILLEAMEAFEEMGVEIGVPARHVVLERRTGEAAPGAGRPWSEEVRRPGLHQAR